MTTTFLDPCEILFTQGSIKNSFRNGLSLEETACQLASKDIPKRRIDMINIVEHSDGHFYSLDNRRLAVFRLLRFVGKCGKIKVKIGPQNPAEWRRKFDCSADHSRIVVRGCKYIIAASKEQSTFPLDRIRSAMRDTVVVREERLAAILQGMDSDDDESEEEPQSNVGQRPTSARQALKCPVRKKNAADQRRGNKGGGTLEFTDDLEPFAAGKSRYAYRCRVQNGCVSGFSEGSYLVLKAFKPEYRNVMITPRDADMQQEVARLAELFNTAAEPTQNGERCTIHVRDAAVAQFSRDHCKSNGKVVLRRGENFLLEREIFGEFRKFNSNNGWASKTGSAIPNAFSHWTWATEEKLVCDLQGYQGKPPGPKHLGSKYYYLFTDPAIMTSDGRYGATDLGMKGVQNWFSVHECNDICRALRIAHIRPAGRRTMTVESSSSYRETQNSYGPTKAAQQHEVALAAIVEGDSGEDYSSDDSYGW